MIKSEIMKGIIVKSKSIYNVIKFNVKYFVGDVKWNE
jgi:hypothetical protein